MTITVKSLSGMSYNLPFYANMRMGQYATQIVAPAVGCEVHEGGDVYDNFVLDGANAFTRLNRDKYLSEVMQDGATLHHTLCLGRMPKDLVGNGSHKSPTQYQLTLAADVAVAGPACKKRKA